MKISGTFIMATKRILKKIFKTVFSFFSFSEEDLDRIAKTAFLASINKRH
jgi:hypothetical protein